MPLAQQGNVVVVAALMLLVLALLGLLYWIGKKFLDRSFKWFEVYEEKQKKAEEASKELKALTQDLQTRFALDDRLKQAEQRISSLEGVISAYQTLQQDWLGSISTLWKDQFASLRRDLQREVQSVVQENKKKKDQSSSTHSGS